MAKDAEINLKINMTPPGGGGGGGGINELFEQLKTATTEGRKSLEKIKESAIDTSEAVRFALKQAKDTNNAGIYEAAKQRFTEHYTIPASLDTQVKRAIKGFDTIDDRAYTIRTALDSGAITEDEAKELLLAQIEKAKGGNETAETITTSLSTAKSDLQSMDAFKEMLFLYEKFNEKNKDAALSALHASKALKQEADALEEQRDALDKNSKTYEQDYKNLTTRINANRAMAAESDKVGRAIQREIESVAKRVAAYKGNYSEQAEFNKQLQKSQENIIGLENKAIQLKNKSEELNLRESASEEKKRNEAEKRAQKDAELAEIRIQKEEEAAARRKKIEEAEIYRSSLLGKTKLEMAAIIKQLNADMKAAAGSGNFEELDALKQKMSIARSAMRNASMQANITRMMFMQQASTASRLSNNISTLADGFAGLSNSAKSGQINITGMASALMDLWFTMKAGMGPVGGVMLGLQAIQGLSNSYIQNSQKIKKAEEDKAAVLKTVADSYKSIETAQKNSTFNRIYNEQVQALKEKYDGIKESLQTSLELIDKSTQAEIRRLSIAGDEEALTRALSKMELARQLEAGEISKADYERILLDMDYESAISGASQKTAEAKIKAEAALRKEIDAEGYAEEAEKDAEKAKKRQESIGIDEARYNEILKQRAAIEAKLLDLKLNEKKYLAQESGFSLTKGLEEIIGAGVELVYDVNRPTETFEQTVRAYSDMNTALHEALLGLNNELNDTAKKLGTGTFGDFNEVETRNALKLIDEQKKEAEANARDMREQHKNATKNRKEADEAANLAEEEEGRIKRTQDKLYTSKKDSLEAREQQERKSKKRADRIEKKLEDLDKLTLKQLESLKKDADKGVGKYEEGTAPRKQYEAYQKRISDEIKRRRKTISEVETAAEAEVQSRAGSNKALSKYSKLLNKVDFKGLSGVLDDGSISAAELKMLQREWVDAVKARNATAMAFIQKIIQDAAESKKQDEAVVGAINKTNLKMAKQAQRMQKKLKTTLK